LVFAGVELDYSALECQLALRTHAGLIALAAALLAMLLDPMLGHGFRGSSTD